MKAPLGLKMFTVFVFVAFAASRVLEAFFAASTAAWIGGTGLSAVVTGALLWFMWRGEHIRARYHQRLDALFDRGDEAEGGA